MSSGQDMVRRNVLLQRKTAEDIASLALFLGCTQGSVIERALRGESVREALWFLQNDCPTADVLESWVNGPRFSSACADSVVKALLEYVLPDLLGQGLRAELSEADYRDRLNRYASICIPGGVDVLAELRRLAMQGLLVTDDADKMYQMMQKLVYEMRTLSQVWAAEDQRQLYSVLIVFLRECWCPIQEASRRMQFEAFCQKTGLLWISPAV